MSARPPALEAVVRYFETISPQAVARIGEVYADDAWFKDPFNEVTGSAAIGRIFAHMFEQVDGPRFVVHDCIGDATEAFLTWDFVFRRANGETMLVRGASHLRLAPDGRIRWHRDYWDTGEELYARLPIVGGLFRWLRRRGSAPGGSH